MGIGLLMAGVFFFSMPGKDRVKEYVGVKNNPLQTIKGGEKATQLQIYVSDVDIINNPPLCDTMRCWSTSPFDEMTITLNNRPPEITVLADYKSLSTGWYTFSSSALDSYVNGLVNSHDTIPFCLLIKNRNGGVCDLVWDIATKEAGYAAKLIHNSNTYLTIGDSWVTDGYPDGPNSNYGADPDMAICSCTLTCFSGIPPDCNDGDYASGTQFAYVEFYIPPSSVEEESGRSSFIFESQPNPFSSLTRICYAVLNNEEKVTLRVYNLMGELVKTLVDEIHPIGNYEVMWDGKDDSGKKLLSGYYFYRLTIRNKTLITKALLLRL